MANERLRSAAGAAEDQLRAAVKKLQAQLPVVRQRLERATASVRKRKDHGGRKAAPDVATRTSTQASTPTPGPTSTSSPASGSGPDDSWTVADLRAEAKRRGLTGYSRKTRAQLLAELTG
jgi:lysophospholipase